MLLHAFEALRHAVGASDPLDDFFARSERSESVRDVAHVTQGAGQMAFEYVGVEVADLAAADGVDEIGVVAGAVGADELPDPLAVVVVGPAADEVALLTVDHGAGRRAVVIVHRLVARLSRQTTNLEEDRGRLVVVEENLRVGRLAIVDVAEAAADRDHASRQLVGAEDPAADVDEMNPVVAEIAVAGRPDPMPVVVQTLARQRRHGGRPTPEVVVHALGNRLGAIHLADTVATDIDDPANRRDRAQVALLDVVDRLGQPGVGAALHAALDDPAVLAGGLDHLPPFPEVVRDGLLDEHVLARLTGPDGDQRVPVVGRGSNDRVDALVIEQLAHIDVRVHRLLAVAGLLGFAVENRPVGVADGHDAHAGDRAEPLDVIAPLAAKPDDADADSVVGAPCS